MKTYLYTIAEIRALEQQAIQAGIAEYQLMQRAGKAALKILLEHYPNLKSLDIVCGKGNNGGDGYVLAHLASLEDIDVSIYELAQLSDLSPTAQKAAKVCHADVSHKIKCHPFSDSVAFQGDVLVDAILGIGAQTSPKNSAIPTAIQAINASHKPVVALDVPSGLDADQGGAFVGAVVADLTITFIGIKRGMLTGLAPNYCGNIVVDTLDLNIPPSSESVILSSQALPQRKPADHKGLFGHTLVIGGDIGMGGAVCLAAEAALRTGSGLVTALTHPEHVPVLLTRCPEVMCHGVSEQMHLPSFFSSLATKITACVIGPGMTDSPWSNALLNYCLKNISVPMVLDAGAFYWLISNKMPPQPHWILTPHPGEAARLLQLTSADIQQARFTHAKALQKKYNAIIVLKGAGTLICDDQNTLIKVSSYHNSAMATAGMGDVLSGIIGSLVAQGYSPAHAASQGVSLHSEAGELAYHSASKIRPRQTLLAHELFPYLG